MDADRRSTRAGASLSLAGIVRGNLMRRRTRTLLTAAGVAVSVGLIVALLSISAGVQRTADALIHIGRADFGLFQGQVSDFTRSELPDSLAARVAAQPGVAQTARIKLLVTTVQGRSSFLVLGLVPGEFPERRLVILSGARPVGDQALVGDRAAASLHVGPGDLLRVGRRSFPIAGVYHSGNPFEDTGAVLPLAAVQALAGRPHEVTSVAVALDAGVSPAAAAARLERRFPGVVSVRDPGQAIKVDTTARLIIDAGWVFSLVALLVGGIGVTNTMAMSVFERMREIGILRAVGWRGRRIAAMVLGETLSICLLALGVGLGLGVLAARLLVGRSELSALVTPVFGPSVLLWGLAFALGVGLVGALYPTWRAIRIRPIEALRRE